MRTTKHELEVQFKEWTYSISSYHEDGEWSHVAFSVFKGNTPKGHTYDGEWMFNMLIPEYNLWMRTNSKPLDRRVLDFIQRLELENNRELQENFFIFLEKSVIIGIFDSMIEDLMAFRPIKKKENEDTKEPANR